MENSTPQLSSEQIELARKILSLENKMKGQINTFYWIAGLSLVNSVVFLTGGKASFVVGLAFTQIVDAIAMMLAEKLSAMSGTLIRMFGIGLDVLLSGIFFLFGYLGHKHHWKTIIAGIALYALDAILLLFFSDWLAVLFHLWMLVLLIQGVRSIREIKKLKAGFSAISQPNIQSGFNYPPANTID